MRLSQHNKWFLYATQGVAGTAPPHNVSLCASGSGKVMKRAAFLLAVVASGGCASRSVYEIVEEEIINPRMASLRYVANWSRTRPLEAASPTHEREVFYKDVAECADALEARREEFLKQANLSESLAALQMNECLSEKGWQIRVVEEIIVS